VQTPDGNEAYTRNGSFTLGAEGTLLTQTGLPVLGDGGPMIPPNCRGADRQPTARSVPRPATSRRSRSGG
jgi:flagellar basal body rod protein FlgG